MALTNHGFKSLRLKKFDEYLLPHKVTPQTQTAKHLRKNILK